MQVERVHYAGLPSHPDYKRCQKYLGGCAGGVFSFDLRGGDVAAKQLMKVGSAMIRELECICQGRRSYRAPS